MLWDIQKEIFCQQLAQISLQRANNCLYSGRFWFKMPKKHKTSQKVAECKVENLLLSNITSTEVYVQYGCNKFQAQLRLRFHTISPTVFFLLTFYMKRPIMYNYASLHYCFRLHSKNLKKKPQCFPQFKHFFRILAHHHGLHFQTFLTEINN